MTATNGTCARVVLVDVDGRLGIRKGRLMASCSASAAHAYSTKLKPTTLNAALARGCSSAQLCSTAAYIYHVQLIMHMRLPAAATRPAQTHPLVLANSQKMARTVTIARYSGAEQERSSFVVAVPGRLHAM